MYRLLLYYLIGLVLAAIILSLLGFLHLSASAIVISTVILVIACYLTNKIFAYIFNAPTNVESVYITALILALIIAPATRSTIENYTFLLAASGLAMASKYILTFRKKHILNPAAIAVALTAIGPRQSASWWIGTSVMLPFVLIGGLLLVRKISRGRMVASFFASSLIATSIYTLLSHGDVISNLDKTLMTSAMFFLGFVMLTEPLTTPPTAKKQAWYAVITGIMFPPQFHILSLYSTPELVLVGSNLFSFLISSRVKLFPTLKKKIRLTADSVDFIFNPNRKLKYMPGQYMEWTLPHHGVDSRGDRRFFTLASSPTEPDIRIGVKFYDKGSTYKEAMLQMTGDTDIVADQISGDFTLPKNTKQKLVFIAGGIGITPYRSMIKYLIDINQPRDIFLLYTASNKEDFAYTGVFEKAKQQLGIKTIYVITDKTESISHEDVRIGRITAEMIKSEIPDYSDRLFYVSGSQSLVSGIKKTLGHLGLANKQIKTDDFTGYA
jgi:ferredoxin-NADP reductase/Na+-translocating ferredoxin:NAD+ oxidoreductase RnfD subunit